MITTLTKKRRRQYQRYNMKNLPVQLSINKAGADKNLSTFLMHNLSDGGAFLLTEKEIPTGSMVKMTFILPFNCLTLVEGEKISVVVSGVVVRKNAENKEPKGIGVHFHGDYKIQYL